MMRDRVLVVVVTAAIAFAAPHAHADGAAAPEHDATFRSGLEQYAEKNYAAAIATWESLLTTIGEERGYKVLYNLGLAYQSVGDPTRAIDRYRAFVRRVSQRTGATADLTDRAADADARATELERTHGALYLDPPKHGGTVLTRIGNAEPRAAGYVVWLAPGRHSIELSLGPHQSWMVAVDIEAGRETHVDTSPPAPPLVIEPSPPRPATGMRRADPPFSTTHVYIGAAATLASFALPATLFFMADNKRDDATALGPGHSKYTDARSSYDAWRTAYYVSYAVPVTLALTTAVLWLLRSNSKTVDVAGSSLFVTGRF
jgi:tetratricopeptide (TPR) repeat protein